MRRFWVLIFVAALPCIVSVCTDGFSISRIEGPFLEGKAAPLLPDEVFRQPFTYLAKGQQCFVFESADRKTVIKFLKFDRCNTLHYLMALQVPHLFLKKLLAKETRKKARFFAAMDSFVLADRELNEESGFLYLHMQEGGGLPNVILQDKAHRRFRVDLNKAAFVWQKKGELIFDHLESRFQKEGEEGLREDLKAFLSLIRLRCDRQIADADHNVGINFAFCQGRPMFLDPGRMVREPSLATAQGKEIEIRNAAGHLVKYLRQTHPATALWLEGQLPYSTERTK